MKKYKVALLLFLVAILSLTALMGNFKISRASAEAINQEDLVNMTRPAIVRVIHHIKGEAVIKPFKLDKSKLAILPAEGEARRVSVDEYLTGSGFVVSMDGYVLTNSHVVSDREAKLKAITALVTEKIQEDSSVSPVLDSSPEGEQKTNEYIEKIKDYLLQNGEFNFQKELVVLDPSSPKDGIVNLMQRGFKAQVVSVNDNFKKDGLDIALVKIDQANLPVLAFGDPTSLQGGEKIGVFGFPTTAELNNGNLLEATFTQGVVSAIKDSDNQSFKLIQTDAKISEGSSGSPLLNEKGEVIGMVTYQTERDKKNDGDNFAFAIPINTVQEGLQKFNVSGSELKFNLGEYSQQFVTGTNLFRQSKCKEAIAVFTDIKSTNAKFNVAKNVNSYIRKCEELITKKQSIDTPLDTLIHTLAILSPIGWLAILLLICAFGALIALIVRDKKEIVVLEEKEKAQEQEIIELIKDNQIEKQEIKKIEEELKEIKK